MPRGLLLAFVLLLACVPAARAGVVSIDPAIDPVSVRVVDSNIETTVLEYRVGSFATESVTIGGEAFQLVELEGESPILEKGSPQLPDIRRSIVIPDDAEMSVRVVASHYTDFPDFAVAPSKGVLTRDIDPATVPYTFSPAYDSDEWYPAELAYTVGPYVMRDVRGVVVVVNPFRYSPSTRTLRVYDRVVVEVSRSGPGRVNVLSERPARLSTEFRKIYERHFLNFDWGTRSRYPSVEEAGSMLVICYDDPGFLSAMQPLVDWKNQMGVPCEMVTTTEAGGTAAAIDAYITQYYNDNGMTYVLLVGDAAEVPTLTAAGGSSDPSYATITPDMYPDIFVGRFSAQTVSQVQTQVLRTIEYEKLPQAGADWYHKGMGVASDQGPGDDGEYDYQHVDNIRDDLLAFTYTDVDQIYDPTGTASMVSSGLNEGRGIINYTGHGSTASWGSTGFSVSHVNALTNDNMLPFIISVACVNGQFTYPTCFAEAWLRATDGLEPTGAIGTYMSSINQSWNPPMDAQDEINDLLVGTAASGVKRTFGGLCYNGSGHMMDEYGTDGEDMFLTWHIFGDPSLRVRTDTPAALTVTHDANVDAFATTFDVTVAGVEGALAALYFDGVCYGSALTGPSGVATIDIASPLPENEDIAVTVTSFNSLTYLGSVHSGGAYVPVISVAPSSFYESMAPDESRTDTLTIENVGDPLSTLNYTIEIVASDGRFAGVAGDAGAARGAEAGLPRRQAAPMDGDGRAWLELLTPNGGEELRIGEPYEVTWNSGGNIGFVRIEYSTDGGGSWLVIVDGTLDDGAYTWPVDATASESCLVRVSQAADPSVTDSSDWAFTVYEAVDWLSVSPAQGSVAVGSRAYIEVTYDATGLAEGDYFADITITSNGGDPVVVPVQLNIVGTGVGDGEVPARAVLRGASPNPFNPVTTLSYGVPGRTAVRLAVYDVTGRLVRTLFDGDADAGFHSVVWDGRDDRGNRASSGVYFCRMEADGWSGAAKMVLLK